MSETQAPDRASPIYQKAFSLTQGASYLHIGKGTLKSAIDRGEVQATVNGQGHYRIPGDEIYKLESARYEARTGGQSGGQSEPDSKGVLVPPVAGSSTPSEGGSNPVMSGHVPLSVHESVVHSLERTIDILADTVENQRIDLIEWREQTKLLTDERELSDEVGQGGGRLSTKHAVIIGVICVSIWLLTTRGTGPV